LAGFASRPPRSPQLNSVRRAFNSLFGRFNSLIDRFNSLFGHLGNLSAARLKKQWVGDGDQIEKGRKKRFLPVFSDR
jgi:hypothetical protein